MAGRAPAPTKTRKAQAAAPAERLAAVRRALAGYASRGVFSDFGETPARGEGAAFHFRWYHGARFELVYRPKSLRRFGRSQAAELTFARLLPGLSANRPMQAEFAAFLRSLAAPGMPAHRRIDPQRAGILMTTRGGAASVGLAFRPGDEEYAARKAANLAAEIFTRFLTGPYYDYMARHFGVRDE